MSGSRRNLEQSRRIALSTAGIDWNLADKIYAREEDKIVGDTTKRKQEIARDCQTRGIASTTPCLLQMHRATTDMLSRLAEASIDADWKVAFKDGEEVSDGIMDEIMKRLTARLLKHTRNFMQSAEASIQRNNIDPIVLISLKRKNAEIKRDLLAKSKRELEIRRGLQMKGREEIENASRQFLRRLYEVVEGEHLKSVLMSQIGQELGSDRSLTRKIASYLADEGLIEIRTHDGVIRITDYGISEVEKIPIREVEKAVDTKVGDYISTLPSKAFISYK
jgi:hypothetical protein